MEATGREVIYDSTGGRLVLTNVAKKIRASLFMLLAICAPATGAVCSDTPSPTAGDSTVIAIINSVIQVFERTDKPVWDGYDLSTRKTLLYIKGRWAVLLNHSAPIPGYTEFPNRWPPLSVPAMFHWGGIEDLAGQLYFNYEVDTVKTVAIPVYTEVPEKLGPAPLVMFAFIVHEAFHQYQRQAFQDMESFSEERYPILDVENNALAALEMLILKDVIRQIDLEDADAVRRLAEMFVAVREYRWERALPIVRAVERAKELQEGSAKYVETRYVSIMADLCRSERISPGCICRHFSLLDATKYLEDDFDERLESNALSPEDVPRHRIYPVGSTLCMLLDFMNVHWQEKMEEGKQDFTLAGLIRESLGVPDSAMSGLMQEAGKRYDFDGIIDSSRNLIERYNQEFYEAMTAFMAQAGIRVEVEIPSSGLLRSRSSRGTRWTMDGGNKVFGEKYIVYTLKRTNDEFYLGVEDTGVLEELIEERKKRVSFFVPALKEAMVDGNSIPLAGAGSYPFQDLVLTGDGLRITAKGIGRININTNGISIHVETFRN
jgi:hypothetical protein